MSFVLNTSDCCMKTEASVSAWYVKFSSFHVLTDLKVKDKKGGREEDFFNYVVRWPITWSKNGENDHDLEMRMWKLMTLVELYS